MLKRYIQHMHTQPAHHRRQHAVRIASAVTAVVFVGWLASLSVRVANPEPKMAGDKPSQEAQLANAINGLDTPQNTNTLEVATTSNYTGF